MGKTHNMTFIKQNMHKHFVVYGGCELFAGAFMSLELSKVMPVVTLERVANKTDNMSNLIVAPYLSLSLSQICLIFSLM